MTIDFGPDGGGQKVITGEQFDEYYFVLQVGNVEKEASNPMFTFDETQSSSVNNKLYIVVHDNLMGMRTEDVTNEEERE